MLSHTAPNWEVVCKALQTQLDHNLKTLQPPVSCSIAYEMEVARVTVRFYRGNGRAWESRICDVVLDMHKLTKDLEKNGFSVGLDTSRNHKAINAATNVASGRARRELNKHLGVEPTAVDIIEDRHRRLAEAARLGLAMSFDEEEPC